MPKREKETKKNEDLRIRDATPGTLAKKLFGGAPKRPETRPKARKRK